jgi:hypothetical protein
MGPLKAVFSGGGGNGSGSLRRVPTACGAYVVNSLIPYLVLCSGSSGGGGGGGGGGDRGARAGRTLSPEAAASRRQLCLRTVYQLVDLAPYIAPEFTHKTLIVMGTALGLTFQEADKLMVYRGDTAAAGPGEPPKRAAALRDLPASVLLLSLFAKDVDEGRKHKVMDFVHSDPFLGPLYRERCCSVCGLLPGDFVAELKVCALCKDPAAGQFCCKDPCFATFWKNGHKNTCRGRDKAGKGKGKKGGGSGAGSSSGGL